MSIANYQLSIANWKNPSVRTIRRENRNLYKKSSPMHDTKITVASLRSILKDPDRNLDLVKDACVTAHRDGARMLFLPELMLTGHGGHQKMVENAEPVPDGPMCKAILDLSVEYGLCICVGITELSNNTAPSRNRRLRTVVSLLQEKLD